MIISRMFKPGILTSISQSSYNCSQIINKHFKPGFYMSV